MPERGGWVFRMMDTHDDASGGTPDRSGRACIVENGGQVAERSGFGHPLMQ